MGDQQAAAIGCCFEASLKSTYGAGLHFNEHWNKRFIQKIDY